VKRYRDIAGDGGSDVAGQVGAQLARLRRRLEPIRFIIAVVSGKGGVGKSTITGGLASAFALDGWRVAVLDADLNGPSMAKVLGARGGRLQVVDNEIEPPVGILGIRVMSMDLLLPSDAAPLMWDAPTQAEAHTWRGTMEANAIREFLADTKWGALDVLVLDLPPGTDRLATVVSLVPGLAGTVLVTLPSDLSQLIVRKSITVARGAGVPVLGLVENMAGLFPGPDAETLAREAGIPFLGAVPFDRELALAADRGEPFVQVRAESDAARALRAVAGRIQDTLVSYR
jgi:ATP-binding protein involved in chromosome partitioning